MKTLLKLIKSMFAELTLWGKFWLTIGLGTLGAAAAMSFDFGYQVSTKHAIFLGLLSILTAFAPETAYRMWELGKTRVATVIAIVCAPFFLIEFYSHAGYTAGLRGINVTEGKIQHTKWDGAQDAAKEDKANLEMWKAQLAKLMEQDAWTATVKADGLREELSTLKARVEEEKNGKRGRRAGCGKECERLQDEANKVAERLGKVEQREDLTSRIEATQRILDKKRDVANTTTYKPSAVAEQNEFLSKAVSLALQGDLKPSDVMLEGAQQTVSLAMALAGTFLPAFAFFLAGLYRREGYEAEIDAPTPHVEAKPSTIARPNLNANRVPSITTTVNRAVTSPTGIKWSELRDALSPRFANG